VHNLAILGAFIALSLGLVYLLNGATYEQKAVRSIPRDIILERGRDVILRDHEREAGSSPSALQKAVGSESYSTSGSGSNISE
jgi:hypothetical protein